MTFWIQTTRQELCFYELDNHAWRGIFCWIATTPGRRKPLGIKCSCPSHGTKMFELWKENGNILLELRMTLQRYAFYTCRISDCYKSPKSSYRVFFIEIELIGSEKSFIDGVQIYGKMWHIAKIYVIKIAINLAKHGHWLFFRFSNVVVNPHPKMLRMKTN